MSARLKVLMTADAVGGVWTYALELCKALHPLGVDVVLATSGPRPTPAQCTQAARVPGLLLVTSDLRLEWMSGADEDFPRSRAWLLRLAARTGADLIHLNGYAHAALPWNRPTVVVAHSCVNTWWRAVHGGPPPAGDWDVYRRRVRAGLAAAGCVVAPTRAFLEDLMREYGALPHARVIPNGRADAPADAAVYPAASAPAAVSPARDISPPFVFACGRRWDAAKRLDLLAAIAPQLPWPVLVAGEPTAPGLPAAAAAAACATGGALTALGELPAIEVARWLRRATIFVHPACYEPFGLAVLEAALAGCALVLADLPSLRESWSGAAVFVAPMDAEHLRRAILALIEAPLERARLARAARARALEFPPAAMAGAYAALYRELTPRRAAAVLENHP